MNKEKFNSQDLIDALVENAGCSRTSADGFLKALLATVEEALLKNDNVRVKDLGTFKLNWVSARKSVNVQTGKDIIIDGYYKVIFTPDNGLKKIVNKPYAHLDTIVLGDDSEKKIDPLISLSEQANEIKELLSEIEMMPCSQATITEQQQTKEPVDEKNESLETDTVEPFSDSDLSPKGQVRKRNRLPLFLLLFFCLFLFGFFLLRNKNEALSDKVEDDKFLNAELISENNLDNLSDTLAGAGLPSVEVQEPDVLNVSSDDFSENDLVAQLPESTESAPIVEENTKEDFNAIFANRLKNVAVKERIKLGDGRYLASLAKEYYGSPHFWVYIFEFNRDVIKNQNSVYPGMEIKLPELDPRLIDLSNPLSIEKARSLEKVYD